MNYSRFQNVILPHWRQIQRGVHSKPKKIRVLKSLAPKFDFKLDESITEAIKTGSMKTRHHPGIQKLPPVCLPDELLKAASQVLEDYPSKSLEEDARKLAKYIWSRHSPLEGVEYGDKLQSITESVKQKEKIDLMSPVICEEERKRLLDSRTSKVNQKIKNEMYHWKPIDFNAYHSTLYILSRMPPDYAALVKVLTEIRKRDDHFSPATMLDFGSGVGTSMWAMDRIWPRSCKEVVCVDASPDMNAMADRLLRRGNVDNERITRSGGTFYKQFLPMSDVLKYDLVVASRSLFELPNMESRLQTLDVLWRKTTGYLVIVEAGTNSGYKLVLEARDYILQLGENKEEEETSRLEGHVFSPCPHDKFCPRYLDGSNIPCNFDVNYKRLRFSRGQEFSQDKYSYVVLKKGPSTDEEKYPRMLRDPMLRKKHIICELCTKYGSITRFIATKGKHSKECYNVVRATRTGDLLPIIFPETVNSPQSHSDGELESNSSYEEFESKG